MACRRTISNACDVLVSAGLNAAQAQAVAQRAGARRVAQVMQVHQTTPAGGDVWGPRPRSTGQFPWFKDLPLAQAYDLAEALNGVLAQYATTRLKLESLERMLHAEGEGYEECSDGALLSRQPYGDDAWRNEAFVRGWLKAETERRAASAEYALGPFAALLQPGDAALPDDLVVAERAGRKVTLGDLRKAAEALASAHDPRRGGKPG